MKLKFPTLPFFGLVLGGLIIWADQFTKQWVLTLFHNGDTEQRMPRPHTVTDFFDFVLVWNHGVSFGILNQTNTVMPMVLIGLAVILVGFVSWWLIRAKTWGEAVAFGLIIGGAIGNIIDRVRLGAVVDFLDFHMGETHWPAFNVADSAVVVGAGLILYLWGLSGKTDE